MATSHAHRDHAGRFTQVPVPPADTDVVNVSGDQDEHDQPGTVYPAHDYRHGPEHHLIAHRAQRVIDAKTGEELSRRITDVRAIRDRPGGRTTTHVVQVEGEEPFWGTAPPVDTVRGHRRTPGTGRTLPSVYPRPDVEN